LIWKRINHRRPKTRLDRNWHFLNAALTSALNWQTDVQEAGAPALLLICKRRSQGPSLNHRRQLTIRDRLE
jgi:hypothetical protein